MTDQPHPADAHRLRDPEHLNDAIRLTSRSTWILLVTLVLCIGVILAWGFFGRLSFHALGQGVVLRDRSAVSEAVAWTNGTVLKIHADVGQRVAVGDPLVSIRLDEVEERYVQAKKKHDAQQAELDRYDGASRSDITLRQKDLDQELKSLEDGVAGAQQNLAILQRMYTDASSDLARGLGTRATMQSAFDRLTTVQQNMRQMTDKLSSLKTQQIEFENSVTKTVAQLRMQVISAEAEVRDLEVQLRVGSTIRSPAAGTVSAVTTQLNATVTTGKQLAVIQSRTDVETLVVHAYLPIDQGKRVAAGMAAQVTPTSIDQQIYGSIRGRVLSVSDLPMSREALLAVLGDATLVSQMIRSGAPIEVQIALEADPNTASGLRWTSSTGPPSRVTPGTTVTSRIVYEQMAPIALILPIVETWTHL
jgi:HlyD family secretion protein